MFEFFSPLNLWVSSAALIVGFALVLARFPTVRTRFAPLISASSVTSVFTDLLIPAFLLTLLVYTGFWWHTNQLRQQRLNAEEQTRTFRVRADTIRQEVETNERRLREFEHRDAVPHLLVPTPDLEVIGSHIDAAWSDPNHNKFARYVIELVGPVGPLKGRFAATDSASQTTRIPADVTKPLPAGKYWWRVGAITDSHAMLNTISGLQDPVASGTDWSAYRSFQVFHSIKERIRTTNKLLIGTNFQQATHFSRRNDLGEESGMEISLIKAIVSGCLAWYRGGKLIQTGELETGDALEYYERDCSKHMSELLGTTACTPSSFPSSPLSPAVEVIPIATWGDWETKLIEKQVDVFVGELSRTLKREALGIRFSAGYYSYHSTLIVRAGDVSSFDSWCRKPHKTGVIQKTTNADLAELVAKSGRCPIEVMGIYRSYPELENAMDRREVDSVIIDAPLASHRIIDSSLASHRIAAESPLRDWAEVASFTESAVYRQSYLKNVIGCTPRMCGEEFGIATVREDGAGSDKTDPLGQIFDQALANSAVRKYIQHLKNKCLEAEESHVAAQ